jgi:hypothetical protein
MRKERKDFNNCRIKIALVQMRGERERVQQLEN